LPEVLVRDSYRSESRLLSTYGPLLKSAGIYLPEIALCQLYLNLRERALLDEAAFLLAQATMNPDAGEIVTSLRNYGFRREAKQLAQAIRQRTS